MRTVNEMITAAVAGNLPAREEIDAMAEPIFAFSPGVAGMDSPEELKVYWAMLEVAAPIARRRTQERFERAMQTQNAWARRFAEPSDEI